MCVDDLAHDNVMITLFDALPLRQMIY